MFAQLSERNKELIRLKQEKEKFNAIKSKMNRISNRTEQSQIISNYFSFRPPFSPKTAGSKIENSSREKTMRELNMISKNSSDTCAKFVSPKLNFQFIQRKEVASLSPLTSQKEITTTTTAATASTDDPDTISNIYLMFDTNTNMNQEKEKSVQQQEQYQNGQVPPESTFSGFNNQKQLPNRFLNESFRANINNSNGSITSSNTFYL